MTVPRTDGDNPAPPRRAVVVVASNQASAGVYADRTGPIIADWLREHGYRTPDPVVVPDGSPVRDAVAAAVADTVDVVLTTGGTGISPTDRTPEATAPLLDRALPGLADDNASQNGTPSARLLPLAQAGGLGAAPPRT